MDDKNYYCHNCHTYFDTPDEVDYDSLHGADPFADPWARGTNSLVCPECGSEDINEV